MVMDGKYMIKSTHKPLLRTLRRPDILEVEKQGLL